MSDLYCRVTWGFSCGRHWIDLGGINIFQGPGADAPIHDECVETIQQALRARVEKDADLTPDATSADHLRREIARLQAALADITDERNELLVSLRRISREAAIMLEFYGKKANDE